MMESEDFFNFLVFVISFSNSSLMWSVVAWQGFSTNCISMRLKNHKIGRWSSIEEGIPQYASAVTRLACRNRRELSPFRGGGTRCL
jgi:hypothetical protein